MSVIKIKNVKDLSLSLRSTLVLLCVVSLYFWFFTVIEEGGVKMKLTVVDTPGFGDQINNDNW